MVTGRILTIDYSEKNIDKRKNVHNQITACLILGNYLEAKR